MSLRVCPSCSRHARETACPFCGADIPIAAPVQVARSPRVILLGAIATAAVAGACSSAQPLYGAPMPDASPANDAAQNDAGNDAMATFYGGPPIDSGSD